MNMLYILVPLALGVLVIAISAFLWAIRNRQFDDLESEGWSVVLDDDRKPPASDENSENLPDTREKERRLDQ